LGAAERFGPYAMKLGQVGSNRLRLSGYERLRQERVDGLIRQLKQALNRSSSVGGTKLVCTTASYQLRAMNSRRPRRISDNDAASVTFI
jgi:hypothetical protein